MQVLLTTVVQQALSTQEVVLRSDTKPGQQDELSLQIKLLKEFQTYFIE